MEDMNLCLHLSKQAMMDVFSDLFGKLCDESEFGEMLLYLINKHELSFEPKDVLGVIESNEWSDMDKFRLLQLLFSDRQPSDKGRIISNVYDVLSYC